MYGNQHVGFKVTILWVLMCRVVLILTCLSNNDQTQESYESKVFMPPERAEDLAQLNLGVEFLRLGAWDDFSSVRPPFVRERCTFVYVGLTDVHDLTTKSGTMS